MAITFNWLHKRVKIKSNLLKEEITRIFQFYNLTLEELNIIFCSDDYLLDINRQFLQHDYYTDIVTFDLSSSRAAIVGEIYISLDRVAENALTLNSLLTEELHRVIFHGVLHICGFKDKSKKDKLAMRTAENFWLSDYFNK